MNNLFENGGRRYLSRRIPDLRVGNNIGKIDKKPVLLIYKSLHKTKTFPLGCVSLIFTYYLEYRKLSHKFKYFQCCNRNGCYATKEHKVKGHGRDTICGTHAYIS